MRLRGPSLSAGQASTERLRLEVNPILIHNRYNLFTPYSYPHLLNYRIFFVSPPFGLFRETMYLYTKYLPNNALLSLQKFQNYGLIQV